MMAQLKNELKTRALVLKRTNYGEADRILQVLTPEGKFGVLAKGVRKEKSRLAGGIELCSVSEVVLRRGRGDLMTLTSARLLEFYSEIMKDWAMMELVGKCSKEVSRKAEQVDVPEYFDLMQQVLEVANCLLKDSMRTNKEVGALVIQSWWHLNLRRASGEELNLERDVRGERLIEQLRYVWDEQEMAFRGDEFAESSLSSEQIKLMRLMSRSDLRTALRVKNLELLMPEIFDFVKMMR